MSMEKPTEERSFLFCFGSIHHLLTEPRQFTDVIFTCSDSVQVTAHKFILASRSQSFKALLYKNDKLDENTKQKQYKYLASSPVLELILEYLYTGAIARLEAQTVIDDEDSVILWKALLDMSVKQQLGHLDTYLCMRLIRCQVPQLSHAAALFTSAREKDLEDVAVAMAQAMLKMPFTEDCLCQLMDKELAEVLTNIPFDVDEMSIVLAVQQWAELNLMDDDDEVPSNILAAINLSFLGNDDLERVDEMGLYPEDGMDSVRSGRL